MLRSKNKTDDADELSLTSVKIPKTQSSTRHAQKSVLHKQTMELVCQQLANEFGLSKTILRAKLSNTDFFEMKVINKPCFINLCEHIHMCSSQD